MHNTGPEVSFPKGTNGGQPKETLNMPRGLISPYSIVCGRWVQTGVSGVGVGSRKENGWIG